MSRPGALSLNFFKKSGGGTKKNSGRLVGFFVFRTFAHNSYRKYSVRPFPTRRGADSSNS